eukprot:Sspe_Gene.39284::Locus_18947_Transcript_1_1_Confidence_1.000_Length_548::g.39284::m.39284
MGTALTVVVGGVTIASSSTRTFNVDGGQAEFDAIAGRDLHWRYSDQQNPLAVGTVFEFTCDETTNSCNVYLMLTSHGGLHSSLIGNGWQVSSRRSCSAYITLPTGSLVSTVTYFKKLGPKDSYTSEATTSSITYFAVSANSENKLCPDITATPTTTLPTPTATATLP